LSFFSDERSSELRDLFFESAAELLQTLNEEGLKLEKNAGDPEVLREVRRTVHTLKGDSAGCGYPELSELAHELDDILTPEVASGSNGELAELGLQAADIFNALLAAYRNSSPLPEYGPIRQRIQKLVAAPKKTNGHKLPEHVEWTEYEQVMIEDALRSGQSVFHIRGTLDDGCAMPAAALQMVRSVLQEGGSLIGFYPDDFAGIENLDGFEAAVAAEVAAYAGRADQASLVRVLTDRALRDDLARGAVRTGDASPPGPPASRMTSFSQVTVRASMSRLCMAAPPSRKDSGTRAKTSHLHDPFTGIPFRAVAGRQTIAAIPPAVPNACGSHQSIRQSGRALRRADRPPSPGRRPRSRAAWSAARRPSGATPPGRRRRGARHQGATTGRLGRR